MGKLDLNLNFYFMEAMNFNSKLYVCSLRAWLARCWLKMQSEHKQAQIHKQNHNQQILNH